MERRAIIIVGPTCSGKTSLSIKLALKLKSEIISADSRQIYKYLNIGTAKPSASELELVQHHFIDYLDPSELYNVSRYEKEALDIVFKLFERNIIPVVAGGSGLYIKALVDGIIDEVDTDDEYRSELLELKNQKGNEALYQLLVETDPVSAETMLPQNWKRVIRALEVYKLSGKFIWQLHEEQHRAVDAEFVQYGLKWDRDTLYEKINMRVEEMIESGLVNEVKALLDMNYDPKLNSLNTVGYKEIVSYLQNEITLDRAIELIQRNTRRYAKRQMTWFNRDDRIKWIEINSANELDNIADFIYTDIYK